jgi:hypothetical protein
MWICSPNLTGKQGEATMETSPILQFHGGEIDVNASVAAYAEMIEQHGFPDAHTQLLQQLRARVEADSSPPAQTIARVLEVETTMLIDASIAGVAAEHLPFLYTVIGEVFADRGRPFRQALWREAKQAEQVHEDAIHQEMRETGRNRLEVVPYMESVALERLQERQERILALVTSVAHEDAESS